MGQRQEHIGFETTDPSPLILLQRPVTIYRVRYVSRSANLNRWSGYFQGFLTIEKRAKFKTLRLFFGNAGDISHHVS